MAFIMKTKVGYAKINIRINWLGFSNRFITPSNGLKGGLWLLWFDNLLVDIISHSCPSICVRISNLYQDTTVLANLIHAPSVVEERTMFWEGEVEKLDGDE